VAALASSTLNPASDGFDVDFCRRGGGDLREVTADNPQFVPLTTQDVSLPSDQAG